MWIPRSLYLRLFVPFASLLVVAMASAAWIASTVLAATLEERLDDRLVRATAELGGGAIPVTEELLARVRTLLQIDLVFFDAAGHPVLSTLSGDLPIDAATLMQLLEQNNPAATDFEGHRVIVQTMLQDSRYSAVAAVASTDDLRTATRNAAIGLGLAAAVATLLLGVAAHLLVRTIVRPIGNLSQMAGRIAAGEREIDVEVERTDEIGALTDALNDMARRLAEYETELESRTRLTALGEMAARIAHEVRNPLTAIKLKLQLLGESSDDADPDRSDQIDQLLREIERLEFVVTSALAVYRPQTIDPRTTKLNDVIADVISLVEPQLEHQGIAIEHVPSDLPAASLDEARIKQVVFNLLHNAANAMPKGGLLRVTTRIVDEGDTIGFDVEDSGPGISDDRLDALFDSEGSGGGLRLGIGLSLCREIVELHGGSIVVSRSLELGGARFSVVLPSI